MSPNEVFLARLIEWEGVQDDEMRWSTESWTRPGSGIRHFIDLNRRTLDLRCYCEDGNCRHFAHGKRLWLFDEQGESCKHARAVQRMVLRAIRLDPALLKAIITETEHDRTQSV